MFLCSSCVSVPLFLFVFISSLFLFFFCLPFTMFILILLYLSSVLSSYILFIIILRVSPVPLFFSLFLFPLLIYFFSFPLLRLFPMFFVVPLPLFPLCFLLSLILPLFLSVPVLYSLCWCVSSLLQDSSVPSVPKWSCLMTWSATWLSASPSHASATMVSHLSYSYAFLNSPITSPNSLSVTAYSIPQSPPSPPVTAYSIPVSNHRSPPVTTYSIPLPHHRRKHG